MMSSLGSEFTPSLILVEKEAQAYAYTEEVLQRLAVIQPEIVVVEDASDAVRVLQKTKKKQHLFLHVNKGAFIRKKTFGQDCTSFEEAYCLDHMTGCHFACVYCYLHSYLKNDALVRLAVNIEDMFNELEQLAGEKQHLFISTGELSDSLLFDPITHLSRHMYQFLKDKPHISVEFRSKSAYSDFVKDVKPLPHFYFTWTISPREVVHKYELKTSSLEDRVAALKRCQQHGLSTGMIVDPMIHYPDWERGYTEMVDYVAQELDLSLVKRLFVGSFRYMKGMDQDIQSKFPKTDLFTSEFVVARDGKYRYYKPLREQMYRLVRDRFDHYQKAISLSMEFPETWTKLIGPQ